ncbi:MAG: hypothetical protein KA205_01990, partial [Acidobacteria bacterium]|nr:hypothetical protein [Acidobacteriota bacterium]
SGEAVASGRGRIAVGTRAVAIRATVPAAAVGPLQAIMRISGGDTRGGDTVSVRAPDGLLADAQLTRIDGPTVTPVAAPVFSRRERLRASWTMMGAGALTRRDARVLDRRGQPLPVASVVTVDESGARAVIHVDLTCAPLAPGDYVIELMAATDGTATRRVIAFRVTQ